MGAGRWEQTEQPVFRATAPPDVGPPHRTSGWGQGGPQLGGFTPLQAALPPRVSHGDPVYPIEIQGSWYPLRTQGARVPREGLVYPIEIQGPPCVPWKPNAFHGEPGTPVCSIETP